MMIKLIKNQSHPSIDSLKNTFEILIFEKLYLQL